MLLDDIHPWALPFSIVLAALTYVLISRPSRSENKKRLPGPKGLPIIGNIHQLSGPKTALWHLFNSWKQDYGPIFGLSAGTNNLVVLGDWETAHELLDRRAANYSSRPRQPMANDLVYKGDLHFLLRPYNESTKLHRRMADRFFTPTAAKSYRHIHEYESLRLLQHLFDATSSTDSSDQQFAHFEAFESGVTRFTASVMYMLFYGRRIVTGQEPEVAKAKSANDNFLSAASDFWICDLFPFLNHWTIPEFLAPWKRTARKWYESQRDHHLEDLDTGRRSRGDEDSSSSSSSSNLTKSFLATKESLLLSRDHLAYDLGVISDAGIDTTACTLMMFLLAAAAHPEETKRAQREIDDNLSSSWLPPDFEDKPSLPFVSAFIKETMRWRPVLPGGIPHANLEDDLYGGYHILKGSVVTPNVWSIHMDKRTYGEDAEEFRPGRWIVEEGGKEKNSNPPPPPPPPVAFGFGRRVCIGQHVARDELFIVVARVLWGFDIEMAVEGEEEKLDTMRMTESLLVRPKPFGVRIRPRGGGGGGGGGVNGGEEAKRKVVDDMMRDAEAHEATTAG